MKVMNLMESVARRLGRASRRSVATSGTAILAGGMFFAGAAKGDVLFSENFDNLPLKDAVSDSEAKDTGKVWTDVPPAGWVRDNRDTPLPDPNDPAVGPDEFYGFTFMNKEWWVATAGDQDRSQFTLGKGNVMVADADEYDDQPKVDGRSLNENGELDVPGTMNVFITTPVINLAGFDKSSAKLVFDSSFRPYDYMAGLVDVSFDNGTTWKNLLTLDLDSFGGVNSSLERVDETVTLDMKAPANAANAKVRFGLIDGGNDWWWAIDNVRVTANSGGGNPYDYNGDGTLTVTDLDLLRGAIQNGSTDLKFDVDANNKIELNDLSQYVERKAILNTYIGDANLDRQFNSGDLVTVFAAGKYEVGGPADVTWAQGDWNADGRFNTGDLVFAFQGGGYEKGPRAAVSAVPEPSSLGLAAAAMALGGLVLRRRR